jgi:DNA-binding transcriptional ArsR family regulator
MVYKGNQTRKRLASSTEPDRQVVSGMKSPERTQILVLLSERSASVNEIADELDLSADKVSYELTALRNLKPPLVKLAGKRKVRGVYEHFYTATKAAYLDPSEWPNVPDAVKGNLRGTLLKLIVDDAVGAVSEDTYDSMPNAHMSWITMLLDEQGWQEVTALLLQTMEQVQKIKAESMGRLERQGLPGVSCTVSMLGYPSANEDRRAGLPSDAESAEEREKAPSVRRKKAGKPKGEKEGRGARRPKRKGQS